jgi:hypothetical protein
MTTLLAEQAACESVGRYILSTLVPGLFSTSNRSDGGRELAFKLLPRLADALVTDCSLGKLAKTQMLRLMTPPPGVSESEIMNELVVCIGETHGNSR